MKSYRDIPGDGGSDVVGQVVAQRRAVESALGGVRHLVAVGSGKGGVGKSTLTLALALAMGQRGRSVAVLDADLNGPSQALLAGIDGRPWVPGDEGLLPPRRADGIAVLSLGSVLAAGEPLTFASAAQGDEHTWRATREHALFSQLLAGVAWGGLDALLIDLPPGSERTRHFLGQLPTRARLLLVTLPSALARGVVARGLGGAGREQLLGYLENMSGYACRGCDTVQPLFPVAEESLDAPCLGRIPFDPELAAWCDRGLPEAGALATSPAFRAVAVAADALDALLETP
ncbi:MAG TPA: P-loop NTPase [Thermoanaerobaculia bacterium]|nr:P-loop NTPase [Thermoanaerobaculia bacterium]